MPTRSGPLLYGQFALSTASDLFTVPAGQTFIVKTIVVNNNQGTLAHFTLQAKDSLTGTVVVFAFQAINTGQPITLTTWLVFAPGDKLQGFADGSPVLFAVYGASLIGAIR